MAASFLAAWKHSSTAQRVPATLTSRVSGDRPRRMAQVEGQLRRSASVLMDQQGYLRAAHGDQGPVIPAVPFSPVPAADPLPGSLRELVGQSVCAAAASG